MTWVTRCGLDLLCCHSVIRFYMLYYSRFRDNLLLEQSWSSQAMIGIMVHDRIHIQYREGVRSSEYAHRGGCHQPHNFRRFGFRL